MLPILTTTVLITSLLYQWLVAKGTLRPAYWVVIINGTALTTMNIDLAMASPEQLSVLLLCVSSVWRVMMGCKGLRRINKESHDGSDIKR